LTNYKIILILQYSYLKFNNSKTFRTNYDQDASTFSKTSFTFKLKNASFENIKCTATGQNSKKILVLENLVLAFRKIKIPELYNINKMIQYIKIKNEMNILGESLGISCTHH